MIKAFAFLVLAAPAAALNFLVMADWGGSEDAPYTTPQEVSTADGMGLRAAEINASFALAVGDNFYSHGIDSVTSPRFEHTF